MSEVHDATGLTGFWKEWRDRFVQNKDTYITPGSKRVQIEAQRAQNQHPQLSRVDAIHRHIYETVDYKLSKEWKTPEQTLRERVGDCEDVDFLAASMLLSLGVAPIHLKLGEVTFTDGKTEKHTWLVVDGNRVDPTGTVAHTKRIAYEPVHTFTLR